MPRGSGGGTGTDRNPDSAKLVDDDQHPPGRGGALVRVAYVPTGSGLGVEAKLLVSCVL